MRPETGSPRRAAGTCCRSPGCEAQRSTATSWHLAAHVVMSSASRRACVIASRSTGAKRTDPVGHDPDEIASRWSRTCPTRRWGTFRPPRPRPLLVSGPRGMGPIGRESTLGGHGPILAVAAACIAPGLGAVIGRVRRADRDRRDLRHDHVNSPAFIGLGFALRASTRALVTQGHMPRGGRLVARSASDSGFRPPADRSPGPPRR